MNTQKYNILWADDEIDLLKPHILFLNDKGYEVTPVNNGAEAVELCTEQNFDIVFLDENMPGMTGLETLNKIKTNKPNLPVVMITKSEEEYIMEDAIGSKIDDYLIKPVNPKQILSSVKKILDNRRLVTEKTNLSYQQNFRQLSMVYNDRIGHEEWTEIYKKLVYWELEIEQTENKSMKEVIEMQKDEANHNFTKFISDNYEKWLNNPDSDRPIMSHHLVRKKVLPMLQDKKSTAPLFFIVIDNLRYDQWRMIQPEVEKYFSIEEELLYYAILPTTTGYARNAIFSGMLPSEMEKQHSDIWVNDEDEEGKNNNEQEFLKRQLAKNRIDTKFTYHKILNSSHGRDLLDKLPNLLKIPFNAVVFNFVDVLSHARTDTQVLRELAPDEAAYRSVTQSWFMHSQLLDLLKRLAENKARVVITTDHGTICVKKPYKIIGDKNVNTNLRYKQGKNLGFEDSDGILVCRKPERFFLPKANVSTAYVFAKGNYFFAYPNNYNYYVSYYKDTFQHGGISLEEIIVPFVTLKAR